MEIYLVGGAVRDELLGKSPKDRDYVVVGATPEDMLEQGYRQVGNTFAVFLHPDSKEEYALARGDSLEEDLRRRDLTINAMARTLSGEIIDPFGGMEDIEKKILRHVSLAFAEDPLRVMRVARFKAQNPDFSIAPDTLALMQELAHSKKYAELLPERIFGELRLVLSSSRPWVFFEVLKEVGGLRPFFSELASQELYGLEHVSKHSSDILVRFGALVRELPVESVQALGQRLRLPVDWIEAGVTLSRFYHRAQHIAELPEDEVVEIFYEMDAFRKPALVEILARNCKALEGQRMKELFKVVREVSFKDLPEGAEGKAVGAEIKALRVKRLGQYLRL